MGALCMQIIEYELKRSSAWSAEAQVSDERAARKLNLAIRKQQQLIAGVFRFQNCWCLVGLFFVFYIILHFIEEV